MNHFFNRFFTMPKTFGQWLAELLGGVFLALAALFLISFLSPPLPFYSPNCATDLHNPADLIMALFFIWMNWSWRRFCRRK